MKRRRIIQVGGWLLLSALASAAVSVWLFSRVEEPYVTAIQEGAEIPSRRADQNRWRTIAPDELRDPPQTARLHTRLGARLISLSRANTPALMGSISLEQMQQLRASRRSFMMWSIECGWPFPCVGGERWYEHRGFNPTPMQYSNIRLGVLRLPSRVLWPGLLANAMVYAAVGVPLLVLVRAVPRALVRGMRRRSGRCAECGYPIGVSPVCTECGAAVLQSPASSSIEPPHAA